jgi:hypothetical protein
MLQHATWSSDFDQLDEHLHHIELLMLLWALCVSCGPVHAPHPCEGVTRQPCYDDIHIRGQVARDLFPSAPPCTIDVVLPVWKNDICPAKLKQKTLCQLLLVCRADVIKINAKCLCPMAKTTTHMSAGIESFPSEIGQHSKAPPFHRDHDREPTHTCSWSADSGVNF